MKHLLRAVVPRHVLWGAQSGAVFDALRGDFMGDVVSVVDELLAEGACMTHCMQLCGSCFCVYIHMGHVSRDCSCYVGAFLLWLLCRVHS